MQTSLAAQQGSLVGGPRLRGNQCRVRYRLRCRLSMRASPGVLLGTPASSLRSVRSLRRPSPALAGAVHRAAARDLDRRPPLPRGVALLQRVGDARAARGPRPARAGAGAHGGGRAAPGAALGVQRRRSVHPGGRARAAAAGGRGPLGAADRGAAAAAGRGARARGGPGLRPHPGPAAAAAPAPALAGRPPAGPDGPPHRLRWLVHRGHPARAGGELFGAARRKGGGAAGCAHLCLLRAAAGGRGHLRADPRGGGLLGEGVRRPHAAARAAARPRPPARPHLHLAAPRPGAARPAGRGAAPGVREGAGEPLPRAPGGLLRAPVPALRQRGPGGGHPQRGAGGGTRGLRAGRPLRQHPAHPRPAARRDALPRAGRPGQGAGARRPRAPAAHLRRAAAPHPARARPEPAAARVGGVQPRSRPAALGAPVLGARGGALHQPAPRGELRAVRQRRRAGRRGPPRVPVQRGPLRQDHRRALARGLRPAARRRGGRPLCRARGAADPHQRRRAPAAGVERGQRAGGAARGPRPPLVRGAGRGLAGAGGDHRGRR